MAYKRSLFLFLMLMLCNASYVKVVHSLHAYDIHTNERLFHTRAWLTLSLSHSKHWSKAPSHIPSA